MLRRVSSQGNNASRQTKSMRPKKSLELNAKRHYTGIGSKGEPSMAADEALTEALDEEQDGTQSPESEGKARERSTIEFPYGDLDDAVEVAKGVNQVGGSSCEWEQLAAHFNQVATGGGFRQRLLTAKVFGLVAYSQGKVALTALGNRICDPKQEKSARATSFLTVPLYRSVYDKFKSGSLPPSTGLEAEMVTLGVARKQTAKARQVFQRSATQAGFFWSGQDRLVMPPKGNGEIHANKEEELPPADKKRHGGGDDGTTRVRHPLIDGLITALPPEESEWTIEKRLKWLRTAAHAFDLIYPDSGEGASINIEIQKDSAK